jgi:hypothetical protein
MTVASLTAAPLVVAVAAAHAPAAVRRPAAAAQTASRRDPPLVAPVGSLGRLVDVRA